MTITYRSVKGARLTSTEIDNNFHDLDDRVTAIEDGSGSGGDNPVVDVQVSGSTLTKYFADGSTETEVISAPFQSPEIVVTGTTHTVLAANIGGYHVIENASGCVISVPDDGDLAVSGAPEWHFRQEDGAGPIYFVGTGLADVRPPSGYDASTVLEGATVTLKKRSASDVFHLFGLLAPTSG